MQGITISIDHDVVRRHHDWFIEIFGKGVVIRQKEALKQHQWIGVIVSSGPRDVDVANTVVSNRVLVLATAVIHTRIVRPVVALEQARMVPVVVGRGAVGGLNAVVDEVVVINHIVCRILEHDAILVISEGVVRDGVVI